jgi:anti-sigma B factor antagonist
MKMENRMRFEESKVGTVFIAKVLESRITADVATRFKQELVGYVNMEKRSIVLDLSDVTFIDSSGLGALIASLKGMDGDRQLVLCGARDPVANMFKLTRMNKVFRMFHSREEAVSSLS